MEVLNKVIRPVVFVLAMLFVNIAVATDLPYSHKWSEKYNSWMYPPEDYTVWSCYRHATSTFDLLDDKWDNRFYDSPWGHTILLRKIGELVFELVNSTVQETLRCLKSNKNILHCSGDSDTQSFHFNESNGRGVYSAHIGWLGERPNNSVILSHAALSCREAF